MVFYLFCIPNPLGIHFIFWPGWLAGTHKCRIWWEHWYKKWRRQPALYHRKSLYHDFNSIYESKSIPWVQVYTMSLSLYHTSKSISWIQVYTMSPRLHHESKSIPWVLFYTMRQKAPKGPMYPKGTRYQKGTQRSKISKMYLKVQGKVQCILKLPKNQMVQGIQRVPKVPRYFKGTLMSKVMSKILKVLVKVQGI